MNATTEVGGAVERREFPATLEGLASAAEFVGSFSVSPRAAVVLDEIGSNIVRCSGAKSFSVELSQAEDRLTIVFKDDGGAFDPTKVSSPDVTASAADREIGGLGLFMVRQMSDAVEYAREGDCNVLTVRGIRV